MVENKVYFFKYLNPKYKHRLHKFDAAPLIYVLDVSRGIVLGINLHWLNPFQRLKFVNMLNKASERIHNQANFVQWTYGVIKNNPRFAFLKKALRRYLINRTGKTILINKDEMSGSFTVLNIRYRAKMIKNK